MCLFTFLFRSAKSKSNQNMRHTLHAGLIMASGPHWGMPLEHAISTNMMVAPPFEKQQTPIWSMVVAFCHAANTNTLVSLLTGNRPWYRFITKCCYAIDSNRFNASKTTAPCLQYNFCEKYWFHIVSVRVDDDASDGLACSSGDQQDTTSVFDALLPPQPTKATICSAGIQHSASTQTLFGFDSPLILSFCLDSKLF